MKWREAEGPGGEEGKEGGGDKKGGEKEVKRRKG